MKKYIEYAQAFNASEEVITWLKHNLANYLEKNTENQEEIEHLIDYLVSEDAPKRLVKMSYEEAKSNTEKWVKSLQKKGADIEETEGDTEMILDFEDGFKVIKLIGENAYKREGFLMRHCLASYWGSDKEIFSLRDKDNMPHCTMEKDQQVKGKGNGDIHPKYVGYVVKFLEHIGMTVGDSEMAHLGYINVEKFKDDLHEDTEYFNEKYIPQNEKLIDKFGEEYMSLDLLDVKPLIRETGDESLLKANFDIPHLCKASFEWIKKKTKKAQGDYGRAAQGDYGRAAQGGDSRAAQGNYSHAAQGDYSRAAQGDCGHAAQGNYSHAAQGAGSHAAQGNYSRVAQGGDSRVAQGDYGRAAQGDCSRAAQGDYGRLIQGIKSVATTGKNSVVIIENNSKVKAKKGTVIVFVARDKNYNIVNFKTVQVDGDKIKESVCYTMENGIVKIADKS